MRILRVFLSFLISIVTISVAAQPPSTTYKDQLLGDLATQADPANLHSDVETLVNFGTRHTLSDTVSDTRGIGAARRWIEAEFNNISAACGNCLDVRTVSDYVNVMNPGRSCRSRWGTPSGCAEVVNVIAIQWGSIDPNRVVIMSGDIDSRVSNLWDSTSDAPGANDNASGVAGTLEAARILSQHQFDGTIIYAALSGEEEGLFGGAILANYVQSQGWQVKAVLNNDMIGNIEGINGEVDDTTARIFSEGTRYVETSSQANQRRLFGGEVDSASRNLARYIDKVADDYVANLDTLLVYRLDRYGRGGHHKPFNEVGIPAVRVMETHENYNRQHQDIRVENGIAYGDVIEGVNFDYAAKLTSLNIVTLASLASAPPFPAQVGISGAVQPSTTLYWQVPTGANAANLAGYKIYWRLTDANQWTNSVWVGMVNQHTLENIMIDNYFFGVASVSIDGFESPIVFPGATGSFGN